MKLANVLATSTVLGGLLLAPSAPRAATFVNNGFETGDPTGWTVGEGFRGGITNSNLSPTTIGAGSLGHSGIIDTAYIDPHEPLIGSTVYTGNYSWRVEDTDTGGYASYIQQQLNNYAEAFIFFAWKAVLSGAHGPEDAAAMQIILTDLTTGNDVIMRSYNAAAGGGGVDPTAFSYNAATNNYYTANWQVEHADILPGHDFLLTVIGADSSPTDHWGYVYLDGLFVDGPPVPTVPEPASLGLLGAGLLGLAATRRRRRE